MEGYTLEALSVRVQSINRKNGKSSSGKFNLRGELRLRSTSQVQSMRRCWTCGKPGHYKKYCKSKGVGTSKYSDITQSNETKSTKDEKWDVYLASTSTHTKRESWLIESGAPFHIIPHRHQFYEYEELKGGDVLLGDDSLKRIIRREKI